MDFPENIDFVKEEEKILEYWKEIDAFGTSLRQSKNKKKFSFYDGPPFATGLPHYGHLLAGSVKDIVTRYAHQTGHHVDRRFGWDCHGVPIEFEIDKQLGIKGPSDILEMGIPIYNKHCRSIVTKYSVEWEETVLRMGRWIDFRNDYKTMYPSYTESVWYVFKQIYEKGLVYQGVKVMPFSTACSTPLSNFEANQNFKEVNDPAVVISFPLREDPSTELIAWTTTPWTLPSNLALCLNPNFDYVKIRITKTLREFILLEQRIGFVFKDEPYELLERYKGKDLEHKEYLPLFNYYEHRAIETGAFRVVCDDYVTADSGTGVVHQAPYFGVDDFRICTNYGIISTKHAVVCPVDECGKFTAEVVQYAGMHVKDADKDIMKYLKSINRLVSQGTERHKYPFCWRSDTPLLYKAVPSWFIRVESIADQLVKSNSETYWVPDFVKENRFGNWLKEARDWAVSRDRFWGAPLPLWVSEDMEEVVCVGSIDELERLSGVRVQDMHREFVDDIIIPSRMNKGILRRVPQVFDCWFEAGCMPYGQVHFPFEMTMQQFLEVFPADFVAEGIDQTRGWFYTLMVISTILFGKSPFKNLIVNGIVLAEDGRKMSKRLKNYPLPTEVINKFGADALRLYLVNSPAVRAQNLRFQECGVRDILKDVFLPWYNAFKFLFTASMAPFERKKNNNRPLQFRPDEAPKTDNIMDRWIISFTQSLIKYFHEEMRSYHLDTVIPRLVKYIDHLTNYYVRMNRRRLRGETVVSDQDWLAAIHTLFFVLYQTTVMLAPFVPFITEFFYQRLRQRLDCSGPVVLTEGIDEQQRPQSVHYLMIPDCKDTLIDHDIEESVALMQVVVELGRKIRDQRTLPLKSPLEEVVIVTENMARIERIRRVESYVLEELNVRQLKISDDKGKYNVELRAELNHRVLGVRLKNDYKAVLAASKQLTTEDLEKFQKSSQISILGHQLVAGDLEVIATVNNALRTSGSSYESLSSPDGIFVLLNCHQSEDLIQESVAREVINRIQRRRKELSLVPEDPVTVYCWSDSATVRDVFASHAPMIDKVVLQPIIVGRPTEAVVLGASCSVLSDMAGTETEVKDDRLAIWFVHDHARVTAAHRQCHRVECTRHVDPNRTLLTHGDVSLEFDVADFVDMNVFLRHVRAAFGWTLFGRGPVVLYDGPQAVKSRCLASFKGRRLTVASI